MLFYGCNSIKNDQDPFFKVYTNDFLTAAEIQQKSFDTKKYTFSADNMPFTMFMRWLSDRSNYGFVIQQGIDKQTVSAEIKEGTIEEIFDTISRSLNLKYLLIGNTYYIGELRKEDRSVFVKRVLGVDKSFLQSSVETLLSETGKCTVSTDCVVVVSDVTGVLMRVSEVCQKIENTGQGTWILQFYITLQKKMLDLDVGAKVNTSGTVSYTLAKGTSDEKFSFADSEKLSQNVEMILNSKSEFIKLVSAPLMLLRDGHVSEWYDGVTVPVPTYTVSQYGVRTVSGYKDYKTGLSLSCNLRESVKGAVITCKYKNSSILGYTESIPHISENSLSFVTEVRSGKIYLVGELMTDQSTNSLTNIFQFGKDDSYTRVQIWCRAYRVGDYTGKVPTQKK